VSKKSATNKQTNNDNDNDNNNNNSSLIKEEHLRRTDRRSELIILSAGMMIAGTAPHLYHVNRLLTLSDGSFVSCSDDTQLSDGL